MEKICGIEPKKIRASYFKGKIPKLLIDIQASGQHSNEDFDKLKAFLQVLKDKDEILTNDFVSFMPQIDTNEEDGILDELNQESLSEAEIADLNKEKDNRDKAVKIASKLLRGLFVTFYDPSKESPSEEKLMDIAFEMLGLEYYLIRDALYKERLYKKKIVSYERAGKQRKLAEDYAQGGVEYRDWALAEGLRDSCKELINLSKKRYKNFQ